MENPVTELLQLAREGRTDAYLDALDALDARWFVSLDVRARTGIVDPTGLMHYDGYVRERAARECPLRRGTIALLAVRCADWVAPVRRAALLRMRTVPSDVLIDLLPLADHLARERWRAKDFEMFLETQMGDAELLSATRSHDAAVRAGAWRRLAARGRLETIGAAARDADVAVRGIAARGLVDLPIARRAELARVLIDDRVGWIAAHALNVLVDAGDDDVILPALTALTASSATLRRRARDWAGVRGIDARGEYLGRLRVAPHDPLALIALAELGHRDDAERLVDALDHPRPRVRAAALKAVGRLDPVAAKAAALDSLDSGSGREARAATRVLRRAPLTPADHARFEAVALDASRTDRARIRALSLLHRARWLHLATLLQMRADGVGPLDRELDLWLRHCATIRRAPEPRLRAVVGRHLDQLEPEARRWVEFVLRTAV